jgi:hypothetical protein
MRLRLADLFHRAECEPPALADRRAEEAAA